LLGGQIIFPGGAVTAGGGRVELGAVGASNSPIQVNLTLTDTALTLGYQNVQGFQDILLSNSAAVNVGGERGGSVQIRGRDIVFSNRSQIVAETLGKFLAEELLLMQIAQ
jgi:hypothetical protein